MTNQSTRTVLRLTRPLAEEAMAVWGWWSGELQELWQQLLMKLMPSRAVSAHAVLDATSVVITERVNGVARESMHFVRTPERSWQTADPNVVNVSSKRVRIDVSLPFSSVLIRDMWLPRAAERSLESVVALQIERELPLPRDRLLIDWYIKSRDVARERILVSVGAVRKEEVDEVRCSTEALGYRLTRIGVDCGVSPPKFNFLPKRIAARRTPTGGLNRYLLMTIGAILVLYFALVVVQATLERRTVGRELAVLRAQAAKAEVMERDVMRMRAPMEEMISLMNAPSTIDLLLGLTSSLPRESWVQRLEVQSKAMEAPRVKLWVITPNGTQLADHLSRSGTWSELKLASSMSAGVGVSRERVEFYGTWRGVDPADSTTPSAPHDSSKQLENQP